MARIPIGMEYTSTVEGELLTAFTCKSCRHEAIARVKSKGHGEATAVAFIGTDGAKSRAAEAATADLQKNAALLARMAPCPKCGVADEETLSAERSGAFGQSALIFFGFLLFMFIFPTRASGGSLAWLVPVVGVIGAFVQYRRSAWRWEEAAERVTFVDLDGLERIDKDPVEAFRPGFVWGPVAEEAGVTSPFVKDLRVGLLRAAGDGLSWLEADELGGLTPVAAQQRALQNLEQASAAGLIAVDTGIYRGHWGDQLAASRLLVPEIAKRVEVAGNPVAFTASEDTFFIAGSDDDAALSRAFELSKAHLTRVLEDDESVAGRFTASPWILRDGVWAPWELADVHPLKARVAELDAELGDKGWRPA